MEVSSVDEYEGAFKEAVKAGSGCCRRSVPVSNSNHNRIVDLALKNRLPAICARRDYVDNEVVLCPMDLRCRG